MFKNIVKISLVTIVCAIILGVTNAYLLVPDLHQQGKVVSYRGGGSQVNYSKLDATGCTAISLSESGINTVENTLEAVAASVASGASVIHLNVHRTSDDKLVVFHDWTLDCATNATGPIHKLSTSDLEGVDAGYGYTFDGGATFPFRGKGFRISRLEEFYEQYPEHEFWLNLKNNDERSFNTLYTYLSEKSSSTVVITSSKGIDWFRGKDSSIRLTSVNRVKQCGIDYLITGWAGVVPESCKNTILLVPHSMAKYFWGYPKRLASRLQEYGTEVYLWAKHEPIDPAYAKVAESGIGIVTSDIDLIRAVQAHKRVN